MKKEYSVIALDQYCKLESTQKQYFDSVAKNEEELIQTFKNQFNFIKGQIIEVTFGDFGRIPAIVYNVNEVDENFHRSYDIILFIGSSKISSTISSNGRYLWRFVENQNKSTIKNYKKLIKFILNKDNKVGNHIEYYQLEEILYIYNDSIITYKLPDYAKIEDWKIKNESN